MKNSDHQNLVYRGSFSTLQTQGNSQYMKHGAISFTNKQNELYGRLLKGLKYYSKEELYAMNSKKKTKIKNANKKAQSLINLWKQELMFSLDLKYSQLIDRAIEIANAPKEASKLPVHKGTLTKELKFNPKEEFPFLFGVGLLKKLFDTPVEPDPDFICTLTFKELGLNKKIIANKFLEARLLPADFASL